MNNSLPSINELIANRALLRWYAEDLERLPLLVGLKNLPVTPLELLVCSKLFVRRPY